MRSSQLGRLCKVYANAQGHDDILEWFVRLRAADNSQEGKRQTGQEAFFFARVIADKFTVACFNEFPNRKAKDNTILREFWIWDLESPDEWVVMHVHFAGKSNPLRRQVSKQ